MESAQYIESLGDFFKNEEYSKIWKKRKTLSKYTAPALWKTGQIVALLCPWNPVEKG